MKMRMSTGTGNAPVDILILLLNILLSGLLYATSACRCHPHNSRPASAGLHTWRCYPRLMRIPSSVASHPPLVRWTLIYPASASFLKTVRIFPSVRLTPCFLSCSMTVLRPMRGWEMIRERMCFSVTSREVWRLSIWSICSRQVAQGDGFPLVDA